MIGDIFKGTVRNLSLAVVFLALHPCWSTGIEMIKPVFSGLHGNVIIRNDLRAFRFATKLNIALDLLNENRQRIKYDWQKGLVDPVQRFCVTVADEKITDERTWPLQAKSDVVFAQIAAALAIDAKRQPEKQHTLFGPLHLVTLSDNTAISVADFLMLKNALVDIVTTFPLIEDIQIYERFVQKYPSEEEKDFDANNSEEYSVVRYRHSAVLRLSEPSEARSRALLVGLAIALMDSETASGEHFDKVQKVLREQLIDRIASIGRSMDVNKLMSEGVVDYHWPLMAVAKSKGHSMVAAEDLLFGVFTGQEVKHITVRVGHLVNLERSVSAAPIRASSLLREWQNDTTFHETSVALGLVYKTWKSSMSQLIAASSSGTRRELDKRAQIAGLMSRFLHADYKEDYVVGVSRVASTNGVRKTRIIGGRYLDPYAAVSGTPLLLYAKFLQALYSQAESYWKHKMGLLGSPSSRKIDAPLGHGVLVAAYPDFFYVASLDDLIVLLTPEESKTPAMRSKTSFHVYRLKSNEFNKKASEMYGFAGLMEFPVFDRYSVTPDMALQAMSSVDLTAN